MNNLASKISVVGVGTTPKSTAAVAEAIKVKAAMMSAPTDLSPADGLAAQLGELKPPQLVELYNAVIPEGAAPVKRFASRADGIKRLMRIDEATPISATLAVWLEEWAEDEVLGVEVPVVTSGLPVVEEEIEVAVPAVVPVKEQEPKPVSVRKYPKLSPAQVVADYAGGERPLIEAVTGNERNEAYTAEVTELVKESVKQKGRPPRKTEQEKFINFLYMRQDIRVQDDDVKKQIVRKSSIRGLAYELLIRPQGATAQDLYPLFDGRQVKNVKDRVYELIRIFCFDYGYGVETLDFNTVRLVASEATRVKNQKSAQEG